MILENPSSSRVAALRRIAGGATLVALLVGGAARAQDGDSRGLTRFGDRGLTTFGDRGLTTFGDRGLTTFGDRGLTSFGDRGLTSFGDTPLTSLGGLPSTKALPAGSRHDKSSASSSRGRIVLSSGSSVRLLGREPALELSPMPGGSLRSGAPSRHARASVGDLFEMRALPLPPVVRAAKRSDLEIDARPSLALLHELLRSEEARARARGDVELARALASAKLQE